MLDAHRRATVFLAIGLSGEPDDDWNQATLKAILAKVLPRILTECSSFDAPSEAAIAGVHDGVGAVSCPLRLLRVGGRR